MEQVEEKFELDLLEIEPELYNVIMFNDDETTFDFVIQILRSVFFYNYISAKELAFKIHKEGQGVVGTYVYDIAQSKVDLTKQKARKLGYPLNLTIQKKN